MGKISVKNNRYFIDQWDVSEKQPDVSHFIAPNVSRPNSNAISREKTPLKSSLKEHNSGLKISKNKVEFDEKVAYIADQNKSIHMPSKSHDFNSTNPISPAGILLLITMLSI